MLLVVLHNVVLAGLKDKAAADSGLGELLLAHPVELIVCLRDAGRNGAVHDAQHGHHLAAGVQLEQTRLAPRLFDLGQRDSRGTGRLLGAEQAATSILESSVSVFVSFYLLQHLETMGMTAQ